MRTGLVDVLVPTYRRKTGLAVVLTSLLGQTFTDFDVIVADQTPDDAAYLDDPAVATVVRALRWRGHRVALHRRRERHGLAEQRDFLVRQSQAPYLHFVDDDVLLEPEVMARMLATLRSEGCGFVGCPAAALTYLPDERPYQQRIELWDGPVRPEPFTPATIPWERHVVNNAANPLHLEQQLLRVGGGVRYKVAWVGGANVLYDRDKLLDVGGFGWWRRLPPNHAGEEVVVQFMLLRYHGGCGILPAGTYHLELETTVADRSRNATELFGDLIAEYEAKRGGAPDVWTSEAVGTHAAG